MGFNPFRRNPAPPTNEGLLKAIVALASQQTPQTWNAFYSELLNSELFIAQDADSAPSPVMFQDEDGDIVLPVFTDVRRLQKVVPDATGYSPMTVQRLCQVALWNDISIININPEQGPGGYLDRDEMAALAENRIPEMTPSDGTSWNQPEFVPMGDSKLPSPETLDKILDTASSMLQNETTVEAAYLILSGSSGQDSQLTIALLFQNSVAQDRKSRFTQVLIHGLEAEFGMPFKSVWLEGEQLEAVQARVEPFYKR
jgi:hypothetical protein